jgi:hypothetical protein
LKKYLAFLLITMVAVSALSAAGVVTTKKAEAIPVNYIVVDYTPGATYHFSPPQYNVRFSDFTPSAGTNMQHTEITNHDFGYGYASMHTTPQQAGAGIAGWGAKLQLDLGGQDWNTIEGNKCTLTIYVIGHIQANGDSHTHAQLLLGNYWQTSGAHPMRTDTVITGSGAKTVWTMTWHGTVEDAFGLYGSTPVQLFYAAVQVSQSSPGAGQASGFVMVPSMVLSFN